MEQSHWIVIGETLLEFLSYCTRMATQEIKDDFSSKLCLKQTHMKEIYLKLNIEKSH